MTCLETSFRALSFGGADDEEDPEEDELRHGRVVESERLNDCAHVSSCNSSSSAATPVVTHEVFKG